MEERFKFRAWDPICSVMLDSYDRNFRKIYSFCSFKLGYERYDFRQLKIMQCTGLCDKNGKLIYEGDILDYTVFDHNGHDTQKIGKIEFVGSRYMIYDSDPRDEGYFDLDWIEQQDCELEVIGNIYENPELLK